MKKYLLAGFVLLLMVGGKAFAQDEVVMSKPEFTLVVQEKGSAASSNLNPFIFHMGFMERVVYTLGLHKKIAAKDLAEVSHSIFRALDHNGAMQFAVNDFREGKPLVFVFRIVKVNKKKIMFCVSNYDEKGDKMIPPDGKFDEAWAMGYEIIGNKFVERKYAAGQETKPEKDRIAIANFYLQDADSKNDSKIEGLLLEEIADAKSPAKGMAYTILTQYYLMVGQVEKAKAAMSKIGKFDAPKGISSEDLNLITSLELAATEKNYP